MDAIENNNRLLLQLLEEWEPQLMALSEDRITIPRNSQNRSIKQIVGHMVDSATNNIHRIIHLQYQENPAIYPDYANLGNNDRWIAIQNYQSENWSDLVQLWKFANKHIVHVIRQANPDTFDNVWLNAFGQEISLRAMIIDYLPHFELHLKEIDALMK